MSRIAYVNGRYAPFADATVHIEDRGYQFADGVYEVIAVRDGRLADLEPHLDRLDRSLSELRMETAMSRGALTVVLEEIIRRNRVADGIVYLQMTRGVARRDHAFPDECGTSVVATARNVPPRPAAVAREGGQGRHGPGHPLEEMRRQVHLPPPQRPRQAGGQGGRRLRSLDGR